MFPQFRQLVLSAWLRLILLALGAALGFVPLFLLPCLFLLALCKRRSASWHNLSPDVLV
jgi:hypothetical protein